MHRTRMLAAVALLSACALAGADAARAQTPAYQRTRSGADAWQARGGHRQPWAGGYYGHAYAAPYFSPTIIAGSYYQRPYPYHFDYYRARWGEQAPTAAPPDVDMIPAAECPCAVPTPVEILDPPAA